jgi:hypothetical protein
MTQPKASADHRNNCRSAQDLVLGSEFRDLAVGLLQFGRLDRRRPGDLAGVDQVLASPEVDRVR